MAVIFSDPQLDHDAQQLAAALGEPVDVAVQRAVTTMLRQIAGREHVRPRADADRRLAKATEILARIDRMPVLDPRSADAILGYNEHGHFDR